MTRGITAKKIVSWGGAILLFCIIGGYGIWRSRDLLFGIRLSTTGISDGMTVTDPILTFSGVAHHASSIMVDGSIVPLSQDGSWHETLALMPGYNVVSIALADKFKRTTTRDYRVYFKNITNQ